MHAGVGVDRANIQDGDLLILEGGGHVGIYKSGGIVIHEGGANYTGNVKTSPLSAFSLTAIRRIPVGAAAGTTTTTITSGIELVDLYGEPISYVLPELERRITEALTWDERILSVDNFQFHTVKKGEIAVTFTAHTIFGDVATEKVVNF